jgi:hypothetical protein
MIELSCWPRVQVLLDPQFHVVGMEAQSEARKIHRLTCTIDLQPGHCKDETDDVDRLPREY